MHLGDATKVEVLIAAIEDEIDALEAELFAQGGTDPVLIARIAALNDSLTRLSS